MKIALLSVAAATAALTACAEYYPPPPPPAAVVVAAPAVVAGLPPGDCFRSADIRNHTVGDASTLYVGVEGRGVYRIGMAGACLAATDSNDTMVISQTPPSGLICAPLDLDIAMSRSGFSSHCIPSSISRMTAAEVDALPPRLRP